MGSLTNLSLWAACLTQIARSRARSLVLESLVSLGGECWNGPQTSAGIIRWPGATPAALFSSVRLARARMDLSLWAAWQPHRSHESLVPLGHDRIASEPALDGLRYSQPLALRRGDREPIFLVCYRTLAPRTFAFFCAVWRIDHKPTP